MRVSVNNPALAGMMDKSTTANPAPTGQGSDFGQVLMDAVKEVNNMQGQSEQLQNDLMANRPVEFHDIMISMERASTALQLTMAVRNKVLDAYQEISKMQI